ncbi:MAG: hypothetical protein INQ03_05925 [Candidatus Heimdallarchaeota archaeon]|nr:hypothetical protein [Candidatus Heimdallarchaeota archaeon]
MSSSSSSDAYSRAIKLLGQKLEKTRERIQEKFNEVDTRLEKMDTIMNGVQLKLDQDNSNYVDQSVVQKLNEKIGLLENTINSLQNEIKEMREEMAKQKTAEPVKQSFTPPAKTPSPPPPGTPPNRETPKPNPPPSSPTSSPLSSTGQSSAASLLSNLPKATDAITTPKKPEIPSAPPSAASSIPSTQDKPPTSKPIIPSAPAMPSSLKKPASTVSGVASSIKMPSTPSKTPKKGLSPAEDGADKDSLLEALKSIDSLVVDGDDSE